jgi:hypothetical protein
MRLLLLLLLLHFDSCRGHPLLHICVAHSHSQVRCRRLQLLLLLLLLLCWLVRVCWLRMCCSVICRRSHCEIENAGLLLMRLLLLWLLG